jgi:hypothetical protein
MIKSYTLKKISVLSLSMFFHFCLFSQVAVVGFANGYAHVDIDNLTTFPSNLQLDKLSHVIAADIGCEDDGTLFTGRLSLARHSPSTQHLERQQKPMVGKPCKQGSCERCKCKYQRGWGLFYRKLQVARTSILLLAIL